MPGAQAGIAREDPEAPALFKRCLDSEDEGRESELSYLEPILQLQGAYRYSEFDIALWPSGSVTYLSLMVTGTPKISH